MSHSPTAMVFLIDLIGGVEEMLVKHKHLLTLQMSFDKFQIKIMHLDKRETSIERTFHFPQNV